jgi:hypothetical protein
MNLSIFILIIIILICATHVSFAALLPKAGVKAITAPTRVNLEFIRGLDCSTNFEAKIGANILTNHPADYLINMVSALGSPNFCSDAGDIDVKSAAVTTETGKCVIAGRRKLSWDSTIEDGIRCGDVNVLGVKPYWNNEIKADAFANIKVAIETRNSYAFISPEVALPEHAAGKMISVFPSNYGHEFYRLRLLDYSPIRNSKYMICALLQKHFSGVVLNPKMDAGRLVKPNASATRSELCSIKNICQVFHCLEEQLGMNSPYTSIHAEYPGPDWLKIIVNNEMFNRMLPRPKV